MGSPGQQRTLTIAEARRLAIRAQGLSGARPKKVSTDTIVDLVKRIGCLQLDPTGVVARNHLLVLFSRLGSFDQELVDQALWDERRLFEYWAHMASIVPTDDLALHRALPPYWGDPKRVADWLARYAGAVETARARLAGGEPVRVRDLEDGVKLGGTGWYSGGSQMRQVFDVLWALGEIVPVGRTGGRSWALASAWLPDGHAPLAKGVAVREAVVRSLRMLGVGTANQVKNHFIRGRYHDLTDTLLELVKAGEVVPVAIEGLKGEWFMHAEDADGAAEFEPRTTLLSPFDNLIADRARTVQLWGFDFKLEIYVPKPKRWGYFVMPLLHGDRLAARFDLAVERKAGVLNVINERWEAGFKPTRASQKALAELADFCGAAIARSRTR